MKHTFTISGSYYSQNKTFPGFNDYIRMSIPEKAKTKRDCQMVANNVIRLTLKRLHINKPLAIHFVYYEPDSKRDLDNIAGTAHKFIIDSLVQCGVIDDDKQKYVQMLTDRVYTDKKRPRIEVTLEELEE